MNVILLMIFLIMSLSGHSQEADSTAVDSVDYQPKYLHSIYGYTGYDFIQTSPVFGLRYAVTRDNWAFNASFFLPFDLAPNVELIIGKKLCCKFKKKPKK